MNTRAGKLKDAKMKILREVDKDKRDLNMPWL
jgi:hypothetical protein